MSTGRTRLALDDLKDLYWPTERAERELLPLALFKGQTSLGDVQAMWNMTQALRVAEIDTCADASRFVGTNPDIAHAAGLHPSMSDTQNGAFGGKLQRLTARIFSAPDGVKIDRETTEYLRHVMNRSHRLIITGLVPIDRYSPYSRVAWRRPRPKLLGPDTPVNPSWPFVTETRTPDIEGMDVLTAVDALIPKGLPNQLREDVCQDVVLAVLTGEVDLDALREPGAPWLKDIFKRYRTKYGTVSLDAPPPWDKNGRTLLETLAV